MVRLFDAGVRFISRGTPISDGEVKGVLKGLKYFKQESYRADKELVDVRGLSRRGLRLDTCL